MFAEFREDATNGSLMIVVKATNQTEWTALRLYMSLFNAGRVRFAVESHNNSKGDSSEQ